MSISEITGQSRHIKAPNRLSFKYADHVCYKMFLERCQLNGLKSLAYQESNFLKGHDSQRLVAPKKKQSRSGGSDLEVWLTCRPGGFMYKPFHHTNHVD